MSKKIRPIKNTILMIVLTSTAGYLFGVIMVVLLGFGYQGTIIYIFLFFPFVLFITLYGFYKGLVRHYGLKGDEKLFWGGKF